MSQQDLALVRSVFAGFRTRNFETTAPMLHPEIEVRPAIAGGPEGVVYRGPEGMREFWREVDAAWEEFRIDAQEFRDLGGKVLVLGEIYARARQSGIALTTAAGWLAVVRENRLFRFQSFTSPEEALEAAGVRE